MFNVYLIGCGGLGEKLVTLIPRTIISASLDVLEQNGVNIEKILENAGNTSVPLLVDRMVLVDGDDYDAKNCLRQASGVGSKLTVSMELFTHNFNAARASYGIPEAMLSGTWLQNMRFTGYKKYLTPENMSQIIPREPAINEANAEAWAASNVHFPATTSIILIGVDNAKTRYEICKYAETFDNVLLINGGNSKTTGHVTVYERRDGVALDPNFPDIYPYINPNEDLRPDEIPCQTISPKHDQTDIVNTLVGATMANVFAHYLRNGYIDTLVRGERVRKNEIRIDSEKYSMTGIQH